MLETIIIWGTVLSAVGFSLVVTIFVGAAYGNKNHGNKKPANVFFAASFYLLPLICISVGIAATTHYQGHTLLWLTVIPVTYILWFAIAATIFRE